MPRAWELLVEPYPAIDEHRDHLVSVLSIKKNKGSHGITVDMEHLDGEQTGRKHSIVLPLPIRPAGITAEFFKACCMEPTVGKALLPKDAIGIEITARFLPSDQGGHYKVVSFHQAKIQEIHNERRTSKSKQHAAPVTDASESP